MRVGRQTAVLSLLCACGAANAQFADDFNRPDGAIGANWTATPATAVWSVLNNRGRHTSTGVNDIIQHTTATGGYVQSVSELDVFCPGSTSQFSAVIIGLGGTDAIMVKIQDQVSTTAGFSNYGIYHRTSATGWGTWTGTGAAAFAALTAPFTEGRMKVYFPDPDTITLEIDTDFNGTPDQTYTRTGVSTIAANLGQGYGIGAWAAAAEFDNWSVNGFNPNAIGACCFTDGSCQFITLANCQSGGGNFRGENVTCVAANCPQPGACCFANGSCTLIQQNACTGGGGAFNGAATCAAANCPQPGACCRFDGTCVSSLQSACTGAFQGAGTLCVNVTCPAPPPIIYTNCNLTTGATTLSNVAAPAGSLWSECARDAIEPNLANTSAGNSALMTSFREADNFVVPAGGMNLGYLKLAAYQTGATGLSINTGNVRIWNGPPNNPASQVVFGDTTTNRLAHVELSNVYRIFNTVIPPTCGGTPTASGTTRRIQWSYLAINQFLPAGEYWWDVGLNGTVASGPWIAIATDGRAIGRQCDPNNANAMVQTVSTGAWAPVTDTGQPAAGATCPTPPVVNQDLYFELLGTGGQTCYANCDNSTQPPVLNVGDFTCFLQRFAAGDSYANCDNSTQPPVLNVGDFTCFLQRFAAGCP
jgi:hypothetical protein